MIKTIIRYAKLYRLSVNVNFDYKIPNKFQTCIYDFYMLNYLHDSISEKDYRQLSQNNYNSDYLNNKQIEGQININNAYKTLCNYLEKILTQMLYYQIARQFSHIEYWYNEMDEKRLIANASLSKSDLNFVLNYLKICKAKNFKLGQRDADFNKAKDIIDTMNPNKYEFVKVAYNVFGTVIKGGGYGGANWQNVCQAYMMFKTQKTDVAIDHVFDLQHNTGNIFYKHPKYNNISSQIGRILDQKRNLSHPMAFVSKCSPSIQDACKYLLHLKDNVSEDMFNDEKAFYADQILTIPQVKVLLDKHAYKDWWTAYKSDRIDLEGLFYSIKFFIDNKEYRNATSAMIGFEENISDDLITSEYLNWLCENTKITTIYYLFLYEKIKPEIVNAKSLSIIDKFHDFHSLINVLMNYINYSPFDILDKLVDARANNIIHFFIDSNLIPQEYKTKKFKDYIKTI